MLVVEHPGLESGIAGEYLAVFDPLQPPWLDVGDAHAFQAGPLRRAVFFWRAGVSGVFVRARCGTSQAPSSQVPRRGLRGDEKQAG